MPHGHGAFGKFDAVKAADLGEQSGQHFVGGEVAFDFGFGESVFRFA